MNIYMHPSYYEVNRIYKPYQVIYAMNLDFNLGCVVKYISRAGRKENEDVIKDLEKSINYLKLEKECRFIDHNITFNDTALTDRDIELIAEDWGLSENLHEVIKYLNIKVDHCMYLDACIARIKAEIDIIKKNKVNKNNAEEKTNA